MRKRGAPEYAGCERHKSCWKYGHCACGGKADGPEGKCGSCIYGTCDCGNKANGTDGKCKQCQYGTCACGNKATGPDGKCKSCIYGQETCQVEGCTNGCSYPGICTGHYYRQKNHGDVFAAIPLGSRIRINGTVCGTDETYLYVCYNDVGVPIYVGISFNVKTRVTQHKADKHWWHLVDRIEYRSFPTRQEAYDTETELIQLFRPEYNISKQPKEVV